MWMKFHVFNRAAPIHMNAGIFPKPRQNNFQTFGIGFRGYFFDLGCQTTDENPKIVVYQGVSDFLFFYLLTKYRFDIITIEIIRREVYFADDGILN